MSLRSFPAYLVRTVCVVLAAALTFAPGFTYTLSAFSANTATSALSVTSDPVDAAVYVDGRLAGTTPLTLDSITVGDHRVRVVKNGYLENSRIVGVGTGKPNTVAIKLTRDNNSSAAALAPAPGGGSKKWLYIGLGVAAIGAAVLLAGGGGGNKAPTVSTATSSASFGLLNASSIVFTANGASDPDGDTLTYNWNFSNGQTATGANPSVVFTSTGAITCTVTVSDGKASATATTSVTIRSMTGTWRANLFNGIMVLTQTGSTVTGTYTDVDGAATLTAGSVSSTSPNFRITINQPQVSFVATFTGNPDASINVITGTLTASGGSAGYTLTRQ